MPKPPKLPPPDAAEVKALAMRLATSGPMPWCLACFKAEQQLRDRVRVRARNAQFTAKHREQAANRIGLPVHWV